VFKFLELEWVDDVAQIASNHVILKRFGCKFQSANAEL
jgi:hypothetical protein